MSQNIEYKIIQHGIYECVICGNKDFNRYEIDYDKNTQRLVTEHKLNHINLDCGKVIVFCNACLFSLKRSLKHG